MEHKCSVVVQHESMANFKWYHHYTLMSASNPLRFSYFRSDITVREEQNRHLMVNKYAIHPFSKFKAWYDVYLIYLYASVLITKPIDAGFVKYDDCFVNYAWYMTYNILTDMLCWLDIAVNILTGYELKHANMIELRKWHIAKHYIYSPYFICDLLSSIPKCFVYSLNVGAWRLEMFGVGALLGMFKVVRIISFVNCMWRVSDYFHITSKGVLFLVCTMFGSFMIIHWLACMQFAVPRFVRINFSSTLTNSSWFYAKSLYDGHLYSQSFLIRYNHCFLKSSAYILGVRIVYYELENSEEYILAILTYFIGKVLVAFLYIVLAVAILNSRIMEIKFAELMNQLQEYMKHNQTPMNLRARIVQHFHYKYRNRYFHERLITSLLSDRLRHEVNMHACKSLLLNVSLFAHLSLSEAGKVIDNLVPEIFLPNDTIIYAGSPGEAMYFLATGTVAVYTRSGKEICHLQDGAYFGEISLVLKNHLRSATIVALEKSHVYRLKRKDLEKYLLANKSTMQQILKNAEERLKEAMRLEEDYKQLLLEQSLRKISSARHK